MTSDAGRSSASAAPATGRWLTLANALTGLRLILAPGCALSLVSGMHALAFAFFWLAVVVRLLLRSKQLDEACARIPLDNDVTTPRFPESNSATGARTAR